MNCTTVLYQTFQNVKTKKGGFSSGTSAQERLESVSVVDKNEKRVEEERLRELGFFILKKALGRSYCGLKALKGVL